MGGAARTFNARYGITYLAFGCPDVPMLPFSAIGLQDLRWRDVLLLRRPRLVFAIGKPFYGRDFAGGSYEERSDALLSRITSEWKDLES